MGQFFYLSVALLALLLFFPVSRLIWVLAVRRHERRLQRRLTAGEMARQQRITRSVALLLVILFSWLFNLQLHTRLYG